MCIYQTSVRRMCTRFGRTLKAVCQICPFLEEGRRNAGLGLLENDSSDGHTGPSRSYKTCVELQAGP